MTVQYLIQKKILFTLFLYLSWLNILHLHLTLILRRINVHRSGDSASHLVTNEIKMNWLF